ncbi:hypothetical protein [Proteiniborus ethanoligenes]|nr:hypothetical protein [Proteiniborus ethanoligenes]
MAELNRLDIRITEIIIKTAEKKAPNIDFDIGSFYCMVMWQGEMKGR